MDVRTGRVELNEFEILQGEAGSGDHGVTVTSASVGGGAREVGTAVTTSGKDGVVSSESVEGAVFLVIGHDTDTFAFVVHDEIKSEVLDEEVGVVTKRLLVSRTTLVRSKMCSQFDTYTVEGVKESVTSSVGGSSTSVGLTTLAELERLTTEGTLVDLALVGSGEWQTKVLKLDDGSWCLSAHVLNGIGISQPVSTLDGVVVIYKGSSV